MGSPVLTRFDALETADRLPLGRARRRRRCDTVPSDYPRPKALGNALSQ